MVDWHVHRPESRDSLAPGAIVRSVLRGIAISFLAICALVECALTIRFRNRKESRQARAAWLHRWCRVACYLTGLKVESHGSVPRAGLLVSNHLSYLDIIAFSSLRPCIFVAKSEVARWPLFGWLTMASGAIFINRKRRSDSVRALDEIRNALRENALVVLFPEGTSSGGATVLPFKSALLAAATNLPGAVTAAAISYSLADGCVSEEVYYWRDMTLVPHLARLLTKREIFASVRFSEPLALAGSRKDIALQLHASVQSLMISARDSRR